LAFLQQRSFSWLARSTSLC